MSNGTTSGQGSTSRQQSNSNELRKKSNSWCWTIPLNAASSARGVHPSELAGEWLKRAEQSFGASKIEYLKVAYEIGEGGLHHLQGYSCYAHYSGGTCYCPLGSTVRNWLLKVVDPSFSGCDVEARRGTHEQAKEYPGKEDKSGIVGLVLELGDDSRCGQGRRTDTEEKIRESDEVKSMIDEGVSPSDVWHSHFWFMLRNYRGVERYIEVQRRKRFDASNH